MNAILQPGEIEAPKGDIPFIRLPERRDVFAQRARRFDELADGHALADYLRFMSKLARAQQVVLDGFPLVPLPTAEQLASSARYGLPPLDVQTWGRDWAWRAGLQEILALMEDELLVPRTVQAVENLVSAGATELEFTAEAVLAGAYSAVPPEALPFIAAALQVYWTYMAASLDGQAFARLEKPNLCPVCGSPPVASLVRIGGAEQGLRYLSCSLCSTQWHMVRIKCSNCKSTGDIGYYAQDGSNGAVKAEGCGSCNTYLKIMYMDKDAQVEPVADDLATLSLDLLMDDAGKARSGPNLFFHPGSV
ncbi:MAG: formate dehydrogenase accessory protein FdhE [Sulfuricella sp.]|nr:formate dehydrogenase accessory protein FdhE [Sulfuricella sp.]